MPHRLFRDRRDAGRALAGLLEEYRDRDDVIVVGLARGGVPVAYEVAAALGARLDVFVVRKLGVPGREELAMDAIASGGVTVINDDVVRGLRIPPEAIEQVAEREGRELLRREQAYREGRPFPQVAGKVAIVVDDGLATGSSMRAAAAEADWPDAYRVNRYVPSHGQDATAEEALRGFERFPAWMWRNTAVLDFAGWLRDHNDRPGRGERAKAGFYGLDLYSLCRSIHEVISYLDRVDPAAAARARQRYACFDHFSGDDPQVYGFAAALEAGAACEHEVVEQLIDLQRHAAEHARRDGLLAADELFYAERTAQTVRAAEEHYRAMFSGRVSLWNLRDRHMADTLDALASHLGRWRSGRCRSSRGTPRRSPRRESGAYGWS